MTLGEFFKQVLDGLKKKNPFITVTFVVVALIWAICIISFVGAIMTVIGMFGELASWLLFPFCAAPLQIILWVAFVAFAFRKQDTIKRWWNEFVDEFDLGVLDEQSVSETTQPVESAEEAARKVQLLRLQSQAELFSPFTILTVVETSSMSERQDTVRLGDDEIVVNREAYQAGQRAIEASRTLSAEVETLQGQLRQQQQSLNTAEENLREHSQLGDALQKVGLVPKQVVSALPVIVVLIQRDNAK